MEKEAIIKSFQMHVNEEESEKLYQWLVDNFRTLYKNPEERIKELLDVELTVAGKLLEQFSKGIGADDGIFFDG